MNYLIWFFILLNLENEAQLAQKELKNSIEMQKKILEAGSFVFGTSPEMAEGVWKVCKFFVISFSFESGQNKDLQMLINKGLPCRSQLTFTKKKLKKIP